MTANSLTINIGDVVSIPGIPNTRESVEMIVGSILQPRAGRFFVRLDRKFEPSVKIDIVTNPS